MSDMALPGSIEPALRKGPDLDKGFHPLTGVIYMGVVAAALLFVAYSIYADIDATGTKVTTYLPYLLLFVALLIALGFEFVNGFHDTANAVATVIYTRSMPAHIAVVWSGMFNLFGVLLSSGAVAFGIVSLLPVELILQVGSSAGLRHGVRASDRRHHLEHRHLVSRAAGLELAHPDRIDHGRRYHQRAVARPRRHLRCGLVAGHQYRQGAAVIAAIRFCVGGDPALCPQANPAARDTCAVRRAEGRPAAAVVDPRHPDPDLHAGQLLPRLQRRSEGHGPHHAHPDRHGADRLRAQPCAAVEPDREVHRRIRRPRARSSRARRPVTTSSATRGRP